MASYSLKVGVRGVNMASQEMLTRQESSSEDEDGSTTSSTQASRRSSASDSGVGYLSEYEGIQAVSLLGKQLHAV